MTLSWPLPLHGKKKRRWSRQYRVASLWHAVLAHHSLCLSHIQPRPPYDFNHPYEFLPVRPGEAPVGVLRRCCSRGHIRLRAPCTAWHVCILMVWLNNSQDSTGTPCDAWAGIVRAPHRNQCFSYPTGPVRGPCVTRKGAVQSPYRHGRELTQPWLAEIPHGRRI